MEFHLISDPNLVLKTRLKSFDGLINECHNPEVDFTHAAKMPERVKEVARSQSEVRVGCVRPANHLAMRSWMLAGRGRNGGFSGGL